jgi:hypothetical protein
MPAKEWVLELVDGRHTVVLDQNSWSGTLTVCVDGAVFHRSRHWRWRGFVYPFHLGEHACAVLGRGRGGSADLVVDGCSLRTGLHPALKPPHEPLPAPDPGGRGTEIAPPFVPVPTAPRPARRRRRAVPGMVGCGACGAPNPRRRPTCYACGELLLPPAPAVEKPGAAPLPLAGLPGRALVEFLPVEKRGRLELRRWDATPEAILYALLILAVLWRLFN